jgi:hypothetical protein
MTVLFQLFENGYNTLQALSFRWDSARGNMCLFTNELVARAVGASLPALNQALCDFFGHENVTHDVDPEAMDSDLQTLWTSVFEQSSLSSVYAAPTRSQLADSEFFVVFKINTWSKNSPHSLEVHHKSKSILGMVFFCRFTLHVALSISTYSCFCLYVMISARRT